MSGSRTRGRLYFLLTAVLTALLVVTFAVPGSAHPGRGGKHTGAPQVMDRFFLQAPPDYIECEWRHGAPGQNRNHYRCTGSNNYREPLTLENHQGLLRSGGGPADYQVANPDRFTCRRTSFAVPAVPSQWSCSYRHQHDHLNGSFNHTFALNEMVMMEDPEPEGVPDPHGRPLIFYAWPAHK